jgi:sulfonate transport system substrate-binding protein
MPQAARAKPWGLVGLAVFVAISIGLMVLFAPNRRVEAATGIALSAPLPTDIPKGTVLIVGDPVTQWVFEHNGWDRQLPFTLRWAQITGGPDVTEAFHARALDVGLGANVPPIHANWVGLPVRIVAIRERRDPVGHPAFVFGIAPGSGIKSIADLRGKKIAFSPSQIQGQIVLQTLAAAGLRRQDVTLVELPSSIGGDVYTSALASSVVDAAPIGAGIVAERYLRKFGGAGARVIRHPRFRDDMTLAYVPETVLRDPAKAAALAMFVRWWGRAQAWQQTHRAELAQGYFVAHQGLNPADARLIVDAIGDIDMPANWTRAVLHQQAAIDLLAPQVGRPAFAAETLFDRRFETAASDGATAPASSFARPQEVR